MDLGVTLLLLPAFFLAASIYSSVGHGGASAYLAILIIAGAYAGDLVVLVLGMNIFVASLALHTYMKAGHLTEHGPDSPATPWWKRHGPKVLLPLLVTSIPCAFVGGLLQLPQRITLLVLAAALAAAAIRLLVLPVVSPTRDRPDRSPPGPLVFLLLGAVLGLLAGATGIGGGVFLSPLIILAGWARPRRAAVIAAAFIVANSSAGLLARLVAQPLPDPLFALPLLVTVGLGALVGSRLGAFSLSGVTLNRVLGAALALAATKLALS